MLQISYFLTEFTKFFRNEIPHVHCTTHSAVIPFYKLADPFKSEYNRQYETIF
jgi:hypothetical protein